MVEVQIKTSLVRGDRSDNGDYMRMGGEEKGGDERRREGKRNSGESEAAKGGRWE